MAHVPQLVMPPEIKLCFHGRKLAKMDAGIGKKSDPFFVIEANKRLKSGKVSKRAPLITIYRSEVIKQDLNPKWQPFDLDLTYIGGLDVPFFIEVYDWYEKYTLET